MCMAKIMQLAKDLLKGGNKEDIYPRTVDSAVYTTDDNNNPTGNTIKTYFAYLDEALGQYMTTDLYAPVGIIVTPSKTALSGIDPTFGQLVDYAGSNPRRDMYVTYYTDSTNYVLPLLYYTEQKLVYAAFIEEDNRYIQVTINSNGSITVVDTNSSTSAYYINIVPMTDVQGYNANITSPESFNFASIAEAVANNRQVIVKNNVATNYYVFFNLVMLTNNEAIFAVSRLSSDISEEYVVIDSNGAKITSTLDI